MTVTEAQVYQMLRTVLDPELGVNMVDLGLVYKVEVLRQSGSSTIARSAQDDSLALGSVASESNIKDKRVQIHITMTLTTPGCPLGGYFIERVQEAVAGIGGIEIDDVEVEMTFDPPWTMDMMKEEAKAELGF